MQVVLPGDTTGIEHFNGVDVISELQSPASEFAREHPECGPLPHR